MKGSINYFKFYRLGFAFSLLEGRQPFNVHVSINTNAHWYYFYILIFGKRLYSGQPKRIEGDPK